jgi:hypothetical protein
MSLHKDLQSIICNKVIFFRYQNDLQNIPPFYIKKFFFLLNSVSSLKKKENLLKKYLSQISYDFIKTEDENFEERFIIKTKNEIWKNTVKLFYWLIFYGEKIPLVTMSNKRTSSKSIQYICEGNFGAFEKISSKKWIMERYGDIFCGFISKSKKKIVATCKVGCYDHNFETSMKKIKTVDGENYFFHVAKSPILLLCFVTVKIVIYFSNLPLEEIYPVYLNSCDTSYLKRGSISINYHYQ